MESETLQGITAKAMTTLNTIFGAVPTPSGVMVTRWGSDPWAKGHYSTLGVNGKPQNRADMRQPIDSKLYWAGEHTSTVMSGSLIGAYTSGDDAAKQLDTDHDPALAPTQP